MNILKSFTWSRKTTTAASDQKKRSGTPSKRHGLHPKNTPRSLVRTMSNGIILDADDVKKILAEKFGVDEKDVIKTQYSYIIKKDEPSNA